MLLDYLFIFVCMSVLSTHVSVYHMHARRPYGLEEVIGSPETGVTNHFEPLCGCQESNQGLLEEQPFFLTTEPSFHHLQ